MTEAVLGIDVGTSGVRIAAMGADGAVLSVAAAPMPAPEIAGDRIRQDPDIWWTAMTHAFGALARKGLDIVAIAVDGTSGTIVAIDELGRPLAPASMYNDTASAPAVDRVNRAAPDQSAARGTTSPLARALTIGRRPWKIVHQADWIAGRLSGHFGVSDENNALKTGYDPVRRMWPDWIGETGLDPARLPSVLPAGAAIGSICAEQAAALGLSRSCRIVAGTTDGCAAFLASGADAAGDGVTSLGTTLTIKLLSDAPVFAPHYGVYSHRIGDSWLAGGASNSGGAVIAQFFTPGRVDELTPLLNPREPTGLDYYPLPQPGERFPVCDPRLAPRLEPRPARDATFLQAILEGISAIEALGYRRLAELGAAPLRSIRTVGGGARNSAWAEMRLARLGVAAKPARSQHAAAGAARLAWRGIGHAC